MNTKLLDQIEQLAGVQRDKTFRKAAEFILEHKLGRLIETGCYRGIDADGQSTVILGLLAKEHHGSLDSCDTNPEHIDRAQHLVRKHDLEHYVNLFLEDSVEFLSSYDTTIQFAYLDSYDHDPGNPWPCQRHQLAEVGAILGKMEKPCGILLDDHILDTGGKTALSAAFLAERGWKIAAEGLQLLFVKT